MSLIAPVGSLLATGNDPRRTEAIRELKSYAAVLLDAGPEDSIMVSELTCTEPGCPPLETVVARLRGGTRPLSIKVHKPVFEVTPADLRQALAALPPD